MEKPENCPDYTSVEWPDYVMAHFAETELVDINGGEKVPNVAGLRRVAEFLLGSITKSGPTQVWPVTDHQNVRATVVYEVVFRQALGDKDHLDDIHWVDVSYSDVADVCFSNTDNFFLSYAVATASTRAEARALRKALKLRCVAAEEVCSKDPAKSVESESKITSEQIALIDKKCKSLDIDIFKFVNAGDKKYRSVYDVTKDAASKMIKVLTQDFSKKEDIPADIKGYNSDWRN